MIWILICTLIGAISLFLVSKLFIKPSYTASVQMYVDPNDSAASADLTKLTYAQKVVATYINFLETKVFYQQVLDKCSLRYTISELKDMTQIQAVNNTEIFQINVTSPNPKDSYAIVQAMQEIAPALISSIKNAAEISVVDPVVLPDVPSSPDILGNTLMGGILGLFFSILFAVLWEMFNIKVKNQEELTKKYSLPVLGAIPNFGGTKKKYLLEGRVSEQQRELSGQQRELSNRESEVNENIKFVITEAYKTLRTNLRFTLRNEGCKKILIGSSIPEEGKSTTSANLAVSISQTGARVLLMDCDLRKGSLHNFFHLRSRPGLSDILSRQEDINNVISDTMYTNLKVIPLGSIPPNPTEILSGIEIEKIIKRLENEFDYILIDTPPITVVSDSLSLIKLVDGVLIVVRENHTSYPNLLNAISKYKFAEANILGFVLNGVTLKKARKNYQYYYQYSNKHE